MAVISIAIIKRTYFKNGNLKTKIMQYSLIASITLLSIKHFKAVILPVQLVWSIIWAHYIKFTADRIVIDKKDLKSIVFLLNISSYNCINVSFTMVDRILFLRLHKRWKRWKEIVCYYIDWSFLWSFLLIIEFTNSTDIRVLAKNGKIIFLLCP